MLFYRVEVSAPATATTSAKTFTWTPDSELVQTLDLELRKEQKKISTLQLRLWDPRTGGKMWPVFNSLPNPAFAEVPIKVFLPAASGTTGGKLVFDGKIASLQPGYPGPSHTTIVAHDHSLDARLQARYKTLHGLNATQIATQLGKLYGLEVDASEVTGTALTQRVIDIAMSTLGSGHYSDWNQIARALEADGLELYMVGKKIKVRKDASLVYSHTFTPDDGVIIQADFQINHVSGPGKGGMVKNAVPAGNKGSDPSATGTVAQEAAADGSTGVSHRRPPAGAKQGDSGAHTESVQKNTGKALQHRKQRDQGTLVIPLNADIGMQHLIALSGWGLKIDGNWFIESIRHQVSGGNGTTTLSLTNAPSAGSQKQAGIKANALPGGNR